MDLDAAPVRGRALLHAHVPDVALDFRPGPHDPRHMRVDGTLAFVDISGFTRMTERLARHGHVGSEEMSDLLDLTFTSLLTASRAEGGDLVKWGGDAVLLLFTGDGHEARAARAAFDMRAALRGLGALRSTAGSVRLRMSVGIHTGPVDLFLVGDPEVHQELVVAGPMSTRTAVLEGAANAGEILLGGPTAAALPERFVRPGPIPDSFLLRARPPGAPFPRVPRARQPDVEALIPTAVRRHVVAEAGEAEHRTVAVAFVRLAGTDAVERELGPGGLAEALDLSVRAVQQATEAHGVTFLESDIDKDGVKLMLVSGAPRSLGHDEERMLRTVRAVVEARPPLGLQIGVNRGHVFTGGFGPDFRRTYSVKGDAVNLSARLAARAGEGEVLVTPEVLNRSDTRFATEELEPFLVKGKAMPIRASRVGAAQGRRGLAGATAPFVGRTKEVATLRAVLAEAAEGRGRQVEVVGEPGIGKSRLVAEALEGQDVLRVVRGPCDEYESSTAYSPVRQLLLDAIGLPPDVRPAKLKADLVAVVRETAPHLVPWLPLLAIPLDVQVPPTAEASDLDEQFRKARMEQVVTELLERLLPGPTVLLLEDSHLMDDASADLLDHIARRIEDRPWLLVVTRREFPRGYVPRRGGHLVTVPVAPLPPAARAELVRAVTDAHPLGREAIAALSARSGGNPMFLEALLQHLGRDGRGAELPDSVESLVTAQVDRLNPLDRTVLRYAAVLGVTVDRRVLESLLAEHLDGVALTDRVPRLAGFLVEDGLLHLRFRHALMRDVAYEGLPFRLRAPLHAQVAAHLERDKSTAEGRAELLSFHFYAAGAVDRAWHYSMLAGERARAKYANADAVDFYDRAVASARSGAGVSDADLADAWERLGDARLMVGSVGPAADAYARAHRLVTGDPLRAAAIAVKQARVDQRQREFARSLRRISRSMAGLRDDDRREAMSARAFLACRAAISQFSLGRAGRAVQWASGAARDAEDAADKAALAQAYAVLFGICVGTGRVMDLPYGRLALQAYTELGDLSGQAHSLNNLATLENAEGEWDQALTDFRRAAEIFERLGDTASAGNALFNQAEMLCWQGRVAEAEPLLDEARRVALLVEDEELQALVARTAGRAHALAGRPTDAEDQLTVALALFADLEEDDELLVTLAYRAEAALLAGDSASALRIVEDVREHEPSPRPELCRVAGDALLRLGRPYDAAGEFRAGLAAVDGTELELERGLLLVGLAAAELALGSAATEVGDGDALLRRLGVVLSPYDVLAPTANGQPAPEDVLDVAGARLDLTPARAVTAS